MSTITSNAICDPSSISVTGKTNGSGTISWSLPTVPAGGTINSCKLTGTCTITDSSGKPATVKVNGTSVSSGVTFTINLGTGNTTTSVAVAATGPHKNTKSTITFSNLVYTVDYETNVTYTVTFKDWDGTTLKTETVKEGSSATAPSDPIREGYKFIGWDKTFSNIVSNLIVTAQYTEIIRHLVARYTANTSGVVPTFNADYDHIINETETNGIYTVEIHSSEDFSKCSFSGKNSILTIEYLKITSNVTDMSDMFYNCTSLKQINTTEWDTSNVIKMRNTFQKCTSLTSLDVSLFDVSNVTHMDFMFDNCTLLTSVGDLSKWNANNLINASSMFSYCNNLTSINLSNLKPNAIGYIGNMFGECRGLIQIDLSNLHLNTEISTYNIFINDYNLTYVNMQNSDYTSVNKIIEALISCHPDKPGVLNIKGIDDISQVDITTANSKYWNVVLEDEELQSSYTVTFKDWDGTILKTQIVEKDNGATAPSDPIRTGYEFIGWDIPFDNIISDLIVTAQYKKINTIIEHTGSGIVVTDLRAFVDHADYKINIDWNSEYFDVIIKEDLNYNFQYMTGAEIGNFAIGDYVFSIYFSDYYFSVLDDTYNAICWSEEVLTLPVTVRFTKNKIQILDMNNIVVASSEESYELNQPIYLYEDYRDVESTNDDFDLKFDLVVSEYSEQPDDNELIQGDINDESGTFEDEVPNVVKTKYIDVSDKKQILVNVLTEDVYILKCYLYNANKELVKVIDISTDKKRMFGLDLQKLIEEVMNDGNE